MADPFTVIGLVSGIITFIDFGFKVAGESKQIRTSAHGMAQDLKTLDFVMQDVRSSNEAVKKQLPPGRRHSDDEGRILAMVDECERVYLELRGIMDGLSVPDGSRSKTLKSVRIASRRIWKHTEIQELRDHLEQLDR